MTRTSKSTERYWREKGEREERERQRREDPKVKEELEVINSIRAQAVETQNRWDKHFYVDEYGITRNDVQHEESLAMASRITGEPLESLRKRMNEVDQRLDELYMPIEEESQETEDRMRQGMDNITPRNSEYGGIELMKYLKRKDKEHRKEKEKKAEEEAAKAKAIADSWAKAEADCAEYAASQSIKRLSLQ